MSVLTIRFDCKHREEEVVACVAAAELFELQKKKCNFTQFGVRRVAQKMREWR